MELSLRGPIEEKALGCIPKCEHRYVGMGLNSKPVRYLRLELRALDRPHEAEKKGGDLPFSEKLGLDLFERLRKQVRSMPREDAKVLLDDCFVRVDDESFEDGACMKFDTTKGFGHEPQITNLLHCASHAHQTSDFHRLLYKLQQPGPKEAS